MRAFRGPAGSLVPLVGYNQGNRITSLHEGGGGEPQTLTIDLANLADVGFCVSWTSNGPTSWSEYVNGTTENEFYIGENVNGWWNLTSRLRFPVNVPQGATITGATLRIYPFARGGGINSTGYNAQVDTVVSTNAASVTNASQIASWLNSGRVEVSNFTINNSVPALGAYMNIPLNTTIMSQIVQLGGWAPNNYMAFSIQRTPPTQPSVGDGTVARWFTFRTGRSSSGVGLPQLSITYTV